MKLHTDNQSPSPAANSDLAYWTSQLAGNLPRLDLPLDRPRRLRTSIPRETRQFQISSMAGKQLQQLAVGKATDLATVLLATFKALLSRYSGHVKNCSGRTHASVISEPGPNQMEYAPAIR